MAGLIETALALAIVLTSLVYMVNPAAGTDMAVRLGKVVFVVFAIHAALSYLWSGWIGRLVLLGAGILVLRKLRYGGKG